MKWYCNQVDFGHFTRVEEQVTSKQRLSWAEPSREVSKVKLSWQSTRWKNFERAASIETACMLQVNTGFFLSHPHKRLINAIIQVMYITQGTLDLLYSATHASCWQGVHVLYGLLSFPTKHNEHMLNSSHCVVLKTNSEQTKLKRVLSIQGRKLTTR